MHGTVQRAKKWETFWPYGHNTGNVSFVEEKKLISSKLFKMEGEHYQKGLVIFFPVVFLKNHYRKKDRKERPH